MCSLQTLCKETLIWHQLRHPSILSFIGLYRSSTASDEPLYLISPLMRCTLWEYITQEEDYHAKYDLYRLVCARYSSIAQRF
jgi:hypothetical protein